MPSRIQGWAMVGRVGYVRVLAALSFALCAPSTAMGMQKEGLYQWRQSTSESTAYLFAADSDSTDSFGDFTFTCAIHSGTIKLEIKIDSDKRASFARLIAEDVYPRILFSSDKKSDGFILLERINFSEIRDWQYEFTFNAENVAFLDFSKTGSIHLNIADIYKDGVDLKAGLEEIVAFRKQCMKSVETSKTR